MSLFSWPHTTNVSTSSDSELALRPERALLTPAWLVALATLGVNDHLLKGAGILPGGLTGKLSDFAGMLVAPALLAALMRVRSRRGLLLSHVAVGAVFSAINVSGEAAAGWSALMGLFGAPWKITVDPSDLMALPALLLSWKALTPAMTRPASPALLRGLEGAAATAGVLLSVATSPAGPEWEEGEGWWDPVYADVYVQNTGDEERVVRLRSLAEGVEIDCFEVEAAPELLLSEGIFGAATAWTLPPGTTAPARDMSVEAPCYAVLVEADDVPSAVLFWQHGDFAMEWAEGRSEEPIMAPGAVQIADVITSVSTKLVYQPADPQEPVPGACAPQADSGRLAWSSPPEGSSLEIVDARVGPDGCLAVDFAGISETWYGCVPAGSFPFTAGEAVSFSGSGERLWIEGASASMVLSTGAELPVLKDTVIAARFDYECSPAPDACGTAARSGRLTAKRGEGATVAVPIGEPVLLEGAAEGLTLHLAHAQSRGVVNTSCSEGPAAVGADVELVAVYRANP